MTNRLVSVDDANYLLPAPILDALAVDMASPAGTLGTELNNTFLGGGRATWMPDGVTADPMTGVFNASARTLPATRKAIARARTGGEPLRVTVLGDSIMDHNGTGEPRGVTSAPARLHDALCRKLGFSSAGTGIVSPWSRWVPASGADSRPGNEPRLFYRNAAGALTTSTQGVFQGSVTRIQDAVGTAFVGFEPGIEFDVLWVYHLAGAQRSHIHVNTLDVDDVAFTSTGHYYQGSAYPGHTTAPTGGATWVDNLPGYIHNTPSSNGGIVVLKITLPSKAIWNVRIWGSNLYLAGVDAQDTDGQVAVTNFALSGMKLSDLVWNPDDVNGYRGIPYAINVPIADLVVQELHINDFQSHGSVANLKTNLQNIADRQRSTAPAGTLGFGTGPGGDVAFLLNAQPDYALHPTDHVQVPPLSAYYAAIYEVAIEKGVPVIDNAWRWVDHATSAALFRDGIHPNNIGADDIAGAIANAITSVV